MSRLYSFRLITRCEKYQTELDQSFRGDKPATDGALNEMKNRARQKQIECRECTRNCDMANLAECDIGLL